jgi:hypothetical protein
VYFDRHTLSVKDGSMSMYTLDGRLRFDLSLSSEHENAFRQKKLREVVLSRLPEDFMLCFQFSEGPAPHMDSAAQPAEIPEYVVIEEPA